MNAVASLTNVSRMKQEHGANITNLHDTHCGYFSLSYICKHLSSKLIFLQICTFCPSFILNSTKMSMRMIANLYKRLMTTTNALPTIK